MGKKNGHGIEALAVRRTTVVDADKVRYRVYTNPTEFIAVIAESALMALRVSGVNEPYRIVRDLPTEGIAITAERMVAGDSGQRVNLATEKVMREVAVNTMPVAEPSPAGQFVPMQLGDLDQKKGRTLRVLSPQEMEAMTAQSAAPAPTPAPAPLETPTAEGELSPEQVRALLGE